MAKSRRTGLIRDNWHETRGNIFLDLGFSRAEAENLRIRAQLMLDLRELIKRRKLTQVKAAKFFGVSQPRISDLMRGKIGKFSVDTLLEMLVHAGLEVHVAVKPKAA